MKDVNRRYNALMKKLETLVDPETFTEIQQVMHLKYVEGSEMTRNLFIKESNNGEETKNI